jgi:hypothetical protein
MMKPRFAKTVLFAAAALFSLSAANADARERSGRAEIQTKRGTAVAERSVSREKSAASRERSVTRPDGATRSVEASRTRTGPGAWEADRTVTGPNGNTRSQSGDFATTRTDNGRTVTGVIETDKRGAVDYRKDIVRGEDGRTVSATGTFQDGASWSRTGAADCDKGVGCASNGTFTNRAGDTTVWSQSRTKTEDGWDKSRDVTFADGATRSVDVDTTKTGQGQATFDRTVTARDGQTRTQTGTIVRGQ